LELEGQGLPIFGKAVCFLSPSPSSFPIFSLSVLFFPSHPVSARSQPGYIGSYCMDAMAMALHCVWTTDSFVNALIKCVNMRGDSDSYGSVCAQIAGMRHFLLGIPFFFKKTLKQFLA
jgi:hypothetical protein